MSSILDALKKLEDEKAEAAQTVPVDIDEEVTGRERVHPRVRRSAHRGMTIPVTPATVGLAAVGLVAVIVAVSVGVSLLVARSASTPDYLASTPTARAANVTPPETATPVVSMPYEEAQTGSLHHAPVPASLPAAVITEPVPPLVAEPAPVTNDELRIENDDTTPRVIRNSQFSTLAPEPPAPRMPTVLTKRPTAPVDVKPAPRMEGRAPSRPPVEENPDAATPAVLPKRPAEPVDVKPAPGMEGRAPSRPPVEENPDAATPAIAKGPALTERPPRTPKPTTSTVPFAPPIEVKPAEPARNRSVQDLDLYSLPILTETDKTRLGLKGLEVNMLRSPNKNRPHPSAIINMQPVYVNEIISGTSAKLIAVDVRGIGIEIGGERFFVRK